MGAVSQHHQSRTSPYTQRLPAHALARQLYCWIIGSRITLDCVALVIDRFPFARHTLKISAQFLVTHSCIDLRHAERSMAEQSADNRKRGHLH